VEEALKDFRLSVHEWSEHEFSRVRSVAPRRMSLFARLHKPVAAGALGCVVLVTTVAIPLGVHHERTVEAAHRAAVQEQKREAAEAAQKAALNAVNDDELMADVDNDIAQATPDALEPLASLMTETTKK
jgi:hypothetical protein